MSKINKGDKMEGVNRVVLSDEQVIEFGAGVEKNGIRYYVDKYGCTIGILRTTLIGLRKAGLVVKLSASRRSPARYVEIVQAINKLSS